MKATSSFSMGAVPDPIFPVPIYNSLATRDYVVENPSFSKAVMQMGLTTAKIGIVIK